MRLEDASGRRLSEEEIEAQARRLRREGQALTDLRHPHILAPLAILAEEPPALALELTTGGTLLQLIQCAPC